MLSRRVRSRRRSGCCCRCRCRCCCRCRLARCRHRRRRARRARRARPSGHTGHRGATCCRSWGCSWAWWVRRQSSRASWISRQRSTRGPTRLRSNGSARLHPDGRAAESSRGWRCCEGVLHCVADRPETGALTPRRGPPLGVGGAARASRTTARSPSMACTARNGHVLVVRQLQPGPRGAVREADLLDVRPVVPAGAQHVADLDAVEVGADARPREQQRAAARAAPRCRPSRSGPTGRSTRRSACCAAGRRPP